MAAVPAVPTDETLLLTVTGADRPGVTATLFATLAGYGVEVLDIEQSVVRGRLALSILVSSPTNRKALTVAQQRGGFGGQPNMQQLMKQAQQMQQQLADAQAELAAAEVTGSAGGGLVTATLTGSGELTAITIDPKAVDPDDVETLQDLVVAAVRDAHAAVARLAEEKMGPLTSGLGGLGGGLGLPGL